jgi:putative RecB family exonuclease
MSTTGGLAAQTDEAVSPVRHLSPSSASTFRQCARRWKHRYIDRLPDPKGIPALVGTFVHRILEELMVLDPTDRTLDEARRLARDLWPEVADDDDFRALLLDEASQRGVRWHAWRLVETYFTMEDPTAVSVAEREQRLEVELAGVPFVGVVDRTEYTDTGLRVTDYKTGKAPGVRFLDDKLSQVWLYAAALEAAEQPVNEVRLMYLTGSSIDRTVDTEAMNAAVDQHSATWGAIAAAIDSEEFPTRVGPLCGWCPYAATCPEGRMEAERRYGPAA